MQTSCHLATYLATSLLLTGSALANPVSFESTVDVRSGPEIDLADTVTDGKGVWIIAWVERSLPGDYDLFYIRSIDNARTWSAIQVLNVGAETDAGAYDVDVSLAADGSGNWLAVWSTQNTLGNTIGGDYDVVYSRSTDNGLTWSAPLPVNSDAAADAPDDDDYRPLVRTDDAGTWVVIWADGQTDSLAVTRSSDLGASWSAAAAVAPFAEAPRSANELETDAAGTWIYVWAEHNEYGVFEIHSTDGGMTWSSKAEIDNTIGNAPLGLATDGAGVWMVAFRAWGSGVTGYDLFCRRSLDDGATWSARLPLDPGGEPASGSFLYDVRLAQDAQSGAWTAAWTSEGPPFALSSELDVVYSQSFDAGLSWRRAVKLPPHAHPDGVREMILDLATDGAGTYVAAMGGRLAADDTGPHTQLLRTVALPDCSPVPLSGCRLPTAAGKSVLTLGNGAGIDDSLTWKWARGEATDKLHFADPTTTADYTLCAYDSSIGTPILVFEKDVVAAAACAIDTPCWRERSTGYRYADRGRRISSVGTLDLKAGVAGKAKIKASAGGAALGPPVLPFVIDPALTIQLVNRENAECWTASYSTFQLNTSGNYKARSDAP